MKKLSLIITVLLAIVLSVSAQEEKKSRFKIKKPNLKIGEKLGTLTGNLMTSTANELDGVVAKTYIISGVYPPEIGTSEAKFYPKGTIEGDYMLGVTFMKGSGIGMYKIDGKVTCDGVEMDYVSLGSYLASFRTPFTESKTLKIETTGGDVATFILTPTPGIGIETVNGESSLPILDLAEDIELTYTNPPGVEGTKVKVSLITDVMGARALNHFATFESKGEETVTVTIPKEALSNPNISGSVKGVGNYNKGENFLIIERENLIERDKMGTEQQLGDLQTAEIKATSYASIPVIVKGKQEESVYASIKVNQKFDNGIGYTFYKPNANYGIPLSKGSKFGLTTFTLEGKMYKREVETSERYGYDNTRIITTTTTTYQFPQLPDSHWEYVMNKIYTALEDFMTSEYGISFVPVETIIGTSDYAALFPAADDNTERIIRTSYKGTQRSTPKSLGEILGNVSSNLTSDNSTVNMMKEADVDGLISMGLNFQVAGNSDGKVVLIPTLTLNINGRDETNNNKQGTYVGGHIVKTNGVPFNGDLVKNNPEALAKACSSDAIIAALIDGVRNLRTKEIELGYDKIWNIGQ